MNILVLTKNLQSYGGGEKLYTYYLLKSLKEMGNDITVENLVTTNLDGTLLESDFECKGHVARITNFHKFLGSLVSNFYSSGSWNKDYFQEILKEVSSKHYDLILIDGLWMGRYAIELNRFFPEGKKIILINHNIEFLNTRERAMQSHSSFKRLYFYTQSTKVRKFESEVIQQVENVIVLSPNDKKSLCEEFKLHSDKVIVIRPPINFDKLFSKEPKSSYETSKFNNNEFRVLFVGTLSWYPNVTGIFWFVEKVLSKLIQIDRHIKLILVGRQASKSIIRLANQYKDQIEIYQDVQDVSEFYNTSHCVVIPVFNGTGIKIKVLEAFASMKPTILSTYVAKDYSIPKSEFFVCDTEVEFIDALLKLRDMTTREVEEIAIRQKNWYLRYLNEVYKEVQSLVHRIQSVQSK